MAKLTVNNAPNTQKITINKAKSTPITPTYNPQKAAPIPNTTPNYNPQPAKPIPRSSPTVNPQPAATAAHIAAAAAALKAAQEQVIAQQKAAATARIQTEVNNNVAANKISLGNSVWKGSLSVAKSYKLPKIALPADTRNAYQKAYDAAYAKALADFDKQRQAGKKNLAQKVWDKVSFGQDRRDVAARAYADKQAQNVASKSVSGYEKQLNAFLKLQASKKAAIENAKFGSKADFDKAVKAYTDWESNNINNLETSRGQITAMLDSYGKSSSRPLSSAPAKVASMFNRDVVHGIPGKALGDVWKYTLGTGSRNIPSIITAPGRLVNFFGNLNTPNRTVYKEGGAISGRTGNAWQTTFNQRQFNLKPVIQPKFSKAEADKKFGAQVDALQKAGGLKGKTHDQAVKIMWDRTYKQARFQNSVKDNVIDPVNALAGAGSIAKSLSWGSKAAKLARASKITGWAFKGADTLASSKLIKTLTAEHKTPTQKLQDAIDFAKNKQESAQKTLLPKINALNQELAGNGAHLDTSVFSDLSNLTDSEAKVLQRMVDGKLSKTDRLLLIGKNNEPTRLKLEQIASKWQDFAEQMKLADKVTTTRFGKGKLTYSPRTVWTRGQTGGLDNYNFRLFRKRGIQSKSDFVQGAVDRYFKSELDSKFAAAQTGKRADKLAKRDKLLAQYDKALAPARAQVDKAYNKLPWYQKSNSKLAGAARFGANNTPGKLWKKSVLKYRPAWTVNNVIYNTQASFLAGGGRALIEQAKMLNPNYWRKAMDSLPAGVKSNIAKEIGGKGKLNKFYSGVENWSRVAAFNAAKRGGLSDEQALRRVNRYLFDYTTKNWERPIKAVIPFWQFQKNVAKASAIMPFDRPISAEAYNRLDRYQNQQYDKEFQSIVPKLKQLGYSDSEIAKIKEDNAKYFRGRLKIGGKYFTTPFNAFSEKQMSQLGFNPYLAAAGETADSVDNFGQTIKGKKASFSSRLVSKFPQADLTSQFLDKPTSTSWISKPGSDGFGLTKTKQGFDKSKSSYDRKLDPHAKLGQNLLSFAGIPRGLAFDRNQLIKEKTLQKVTSEYFKQDWSKMDYPTEQSKKNALFKNYGITADDFYKGILAKYDTENTKNIKAQKEAAGNANKSLFAEYMKQPKGTRNLWATQKLRELVSAGYFDKNPFLKSFNWINPDTVAKADKQGAYLKAKSTGDFTAFEKTYGKKQTAKSLAMKKALATGDWSYYAATYGIKHKETPFKFDGKFFKSAASMQAYIDGQFWRKYALASASGRKKLLADNPQYNTRGNWTRSQWTAWRNDKNSKELAKSMALPGFSNKVQGFKSTAIDKSIRFASSKGKRGKKITYRLSKA